MRVDLYSLIHKAQRKHLFELSIKIGQTDLRDGSQVSDLKEELRDAVKWLREHAEHEETFVHPLFHKIGGQGDFIEQEHHDLEHLLENLEKSLASESQGDLYTRFNQFLAAYLAHIDSEEMAQKDILWKHYDDGALMEVMKKFKENRTPSQSMEDLEFMLPCLSPEETERILGTMKGNVPDHVYEAACLIVPKPYR